MTRSKICREIPKGSSQISVSLRWKSLFEEAFLHTAFCPTVTFGPAIIGQYRASKSRHLNDTLMDEEAVRKINLIEVRD